MAAARKAHVPRRRKTLFGDDGAPGGLSHGRQPQDQPAASEDENLDEFGREHYEKLQALARSMLSGLYMLVRSVKMYDPDNAVFEKPLMSAAGHINQIISKRGPLELMGVKDSFYLNNMLVKVDLNALDNMRYLLEEMRARTWAASP